MVYFMENPLKMDGDWGYPGYPGYPETPIWMEVSEDRGLSPKIVGNFPV